MKITEGGQLTIPKHIRDKYGWSNEVEVEIVPEEDGIRIRRRKRDAHPAARIRGTAKLKYAESVDEYIEEIRGR